MRHFDVWQIFVSPQVKRIVIISNKHGIYELSHELPNDVRLRTWGNIKKISRLHRIIAWCSVLLPSFVNTSKKLLKNRNWTFPVGCYFTEKLQFVWSILARIQYLNIFCYPCLTEDHDSLQETFRNSVHWNNVEIFKSSYRRCSVRKDLLRNFAKSTGKHLCQSLLF